MKQARYRKDKYCMIHLYQLPKSVKIQRQNKIMVARDWLEGGMGNYCLMGLEFHFEKTKKFWDG